MAVLRRDLRFQGGRVTLQLLGGGQSDCLLFWGRRQLVPCRYLLRLEIRQGALGLADGSVGAGPFGLQRGEVILRGPDVDVECQPGGVELCDGCSCGIDLHLQRRGAGLQCETFSLKPGDDGRVLFGRGLEQVLLDGARRCASWFTTPFETPVADPELAVACGANSSMLVSTPGTTTAAASRRVKAEWFEGLSIETPRRDTVNAALWPHFVVPMLWVEMRAIAGRVPLEFPLLLRAFSGGVLAFSAATTRF